MAVPGVEPGSSGSQPLMLTTTPYDQSDKSWGCSSLGRAVGSQSAGTGIETLLLHFLVIRKANWRRGLAR